ncbi:MAG: ABC transporter ATP-binding protein [Thermodesulfobacteriota bacterium]
MQIEFRNISKQFGSIWANRNISITLESGLVHGLLGENGAGKSTLMKILSGYLQPSSGEVLINGRATLLHPPLLARRLGVGMLYQEPMDVARLTVFENYILGHSTTGFLSKAVYQTRLQVCANKLGFRLHPKQCLEELTIGERQQLEIVRLLSLGVNTLILDEPTTGISNLQKETLFSALRTLAADGKTILLVSHKIKDIIALCDHVAVLRNGELLSRHEKPFSEKILLENMFGDVPDHPRAKAGKGKLGPPVLAMENVTTFHGRSGLQQCNAVIRESEIVGLAGVDGSGQESFLRIAGGLIPAEEGSLFVCGTPISRNRYHELRQRGVFFIPAARLEEGLITGITIAEHLALLQPKPPFFLSWKKIWLQTLARLSSFDIRGLPESLVQELSGGNQQRLMLSFIPQNPTILLCENPTRGLDIASSGDMWRRLQQLCGQGASIVFSSPDLEEVITYAQRILVFFNGRIIQDVPKERTDAYLLGQAIAGIA